MEELTIERKIILNLMARSLADSSDGAVLSESEILDADWKTVAKESIAQAVVWSAFESAQVYKDFIPTKIYEAWQNFAFAAVPKNLAVVGWQKDLVDLMDEKELPYLILKGTSASSYYPNPEWRLLGDVDFLIRPEDRVRVETALTEAGYEKWNNEHVCHVVFKKDGAHLEMHFEVAGIPYGKAGEQVREFLKNATDHYLVKEQESCSFKAPTDDMHGVIILLHMQHHMLGEGLGLRHLCDWATYVKKTANEPFWEETTLPFLKKIGLLKYAVTMTKTCAIYLGIPCPAWAEKGDEKLCREIIEDVFSSGNFGRKDGARAKSGMLISEHGKNGTKKGAIYNLAHSLHSYVWMQPWVRKCPILYPFVYVWKALRFLFLSMIGKRPNLIKIRSHAEERKAIYKKLKIFEPDKN